MTIRLNPGNLSQTRSDLGLTIGTDVLAPNGSAASLTAIPAAQITGTLPAVNGGSITDLNATNLGSGTVPDARFPATLPAASGVNLTALNATNLGSGSVPDARLPANLQSFPAPGSDGNILTAASGAWTSAAAAAGGAWSVRSSGTLSSTAALEVTSLTKTTSLWFTNVKLSSDAGYLPIVTLSDDNGSSYITTTTYDYKNMTSLQTSQGNWSLGNGSWGAASDEGFSGWFTIFDPNQAVAQTNALWNMIGQNTSGTLQQVNGGGIHKQALDIDAFKFGNSSTVTFASGKYLVLELN